MGRFTTTTKDIGLLMQLKNDGQLNLSPEFQRNAVWPRSAKAYLVDTILSDKPIPVLYFQRITSAQTGRVAYNVIDGQQRLNAIFQFIENRFSLTESESAPWSKKRWKALTDEEKQRIFSYDFVVQELTGYHNEDVRDMFKRMNRYVVSLSSQELRHALKDGAFKKFVEKLGSREFWVTNRIVTQGAAKRMRADELAAELAILLIEGPQDKKQTIDLYYRKYEDTFEIGYEIEQRLDEILAFISNSLPNLSATKLSSHVSFYALVGALDAVTSDGLALSDLNPERVGRALEAFSDELQQSVRSYVAERYFVAASRQTDNIQPRKTRIEILSEIIRQA